MTRRHFSLLASLVAASICLSQSPAAAEIIEGRILDGEASASAMSRHSQGEDFRVPLADQTVAIELLGGSGGWTVRTDAEGRFQLDTGSSSLPLGAHLVARAEVRGRQLFSPAFRPTASGSQALDVFVYPTTDRAEDVTCELGVVHDLITEGTEDEPEILFRVRLVAYFISRSPGLYVGKRERSQWREVFRVPLPSEARVLENLGPVDGLEWKRSTDGRWLIIDEPVPGSPDQLALLEKGVRWTWSATWVAPARQVMSFTYAFPVRCSRFLAYAEEGSVKLVSAGELSQPATISQDPLTGEPAKFEAHGLRGGSSETLEPGSRLTIGVQVDNSALGTISHRAIKWHGGFLMVCLVAMLLGLAVSPRRPPPEALGGLSQEEILDRIAQLDKRFERGAIREKEYRGLREALVRIAAEELDAAERPESPPVAETARAGGVPAAAQSILARIRELDAKGATTPEAIQERAHLLEALYKKLDEESPT